MYGFAAGDCVLGGGRGGDRFQTSDDYVVMALQASTQVDGFGHVGGDHTLYNGYWAGVVTAASGARRLGMHKLAAHGFVGRCVLLDVARHMGVDRLEAGFGIGADELDAAASRAGRDRRSRRRAPRAHRPDRLEGGAAGGHRGRDHARGAGHVDAGDPLARRSRRSR